MNSPPYARMSCLCCRMRQMRNRRGGEIPHLGYDLSHYACFGVAICHDGWMDEVA